MAVKPEVISYLQQQLASGHSLESVVEVLERASYSKEDITFVIDALRNDATSRIRPEEKSDTPVSVKEQMEQLVKSAEEEETREEKSTGKEESSPIERGRKRLSEKSNTTPELPHHDDLHITPPGKIPDDHTYFHVLKDMFSHPEHLMEKTGEGSLGYMLKTMLLTLPLTLAVLLIVDSLVPLVDQGTEMGMRVLILLGTLAGGYAGLTVLMVILLLPMHLGLRLAGAKGGLRKTYRSYFLCTLPIFATLWVPVVNVVYLIRSKLLFYEFMKAKHELSRERLFWGIVLGFVFILILVGICAGAYFLVRG